MSRLNLLNPPFAELLGIKITHLSPERVTGELAVRHELATIPDIIHGGAIMALADNIGGAATVANLPDGASTTTIESKTNFLRRFPSAMSRTLSARRCIAAAPPWFGRPGSRATTADFAQW